MSSIEPALSVPPLYSPFTPAIHPEHERIQERSSEWARCLGIGSEPLRAQLVQQDIGTFASRVLPDGNAEVVELLAEFIIWLFGIDDDLCEEGPLGNRPGELSRSLSLLLRAAQSPHSQVLRGNPLADGIRDLRLRLDRHATHGQLARWISGTREYFLSLVWEAHHRSHGSTPDLSDYALIRLYNGAATAAEPFLEIARGYELSPSERHHPVIEGLAEMAFFIIGWDNDIFSFHKENRGPHYYMNAVRVMHATHGVAPREALKQVIAQRDRVTAHFLRVRDRCAAPLTYGQLRYIRGLESFVRGNQDWGVTSRRYTNPGDPADLPSGFTTVPTDDQPQPLSIPAIQEWWQL